MTLAAVNSTCENPMCGCSPCRCTKCRCGVAQLGTLEERVMQILWAASPEEMTVRSVKELLPDHAYTTVATVLERLHHKGLANRRPGPARVIRFSAVGTTGDHTAMLMYDLLTRSDEPVEAIRRLGAFLTPSEARELLDVINEKLAN
jgi:predicted transcriptional regulator